MTRVAAGRSARLVVTVVAAAGLVFLAATTSSPAVPHAGVEARAAVAPGTAADAGRLGPAADEPRNPRAVVGGPAESVAPASDSSARSAPSRLVIPALGVMAPVVGLGIADDGAIEVPADPTTVGWVQTTPTPGDQGPAVLAGHVDSTTGPAVFYRLRELAAGDRVEVTRRDGRTVRFTVDAVRVYAKDRFPTAEVYGPVPAPALRLITCGGDFDPSRGGYQDNVVVFASPAAP